MCASLQPTVEMGGRDVIVTFDGTSRSDPHFHAPTSPTVTTAAHFRAADRANVAELITIGFAIAYHFGGCRSGGTRTAPLEGADGCCYGLQLSQ